MSNDIYVVCGGTKGIGITVVEELSKKGTVILGGTSEKSVGKAVAELKEKGIEVIPAICDITKPEQVDALVKTATDAGKIAGVAVVSGVTPVEPDWKKIFAVDLFGHLSIMRAFFPVMDEGTAMVCVASEAGYMINPELLAGGIDDVLLAADTYENIDGFFADIQRFIRPGSETTDAYNTAKRGVHVQVRKQAMMFASRGLRIVSVSPGMIDTQTTRDEFDRDAQTEAKEMHMLIENLVPLKRLGDTQEIADAIAYLLSDKASFVTGTDLLVDGGCIGAMASFKVSVA